MSKFKKPNNQKFTKRGYVDAFESKVAKASNEFSVKPIVKPKDKPTTSKKSVTKEEPTPATTPLKDKKTTIPKIVKLKSLVKKIKIPSWRPHPKFSKRGFVMGAVLIFLIGWFLMSSIANKDGSSDDNTGEENQLTEESTPEGTQFNPDADSTTYQDEIDNSTITISKQPLPQDIKENPAGAKELALSLLNRISIDQVETDKGVVHVALIEGGMQRSILVYQDLLVFIESSQFLSNATWAEYVNNLDLEE